jgi:hypothetical protein
VKLGRVTIWLFEPEHYGDELAETHEGLGKLVVSGCHATTLLDAAEEALDTVALLGERLVVPSEFDAVRRLRHIVTFGQNRAPAV